jgi:hypothetical protein
LLVVTLSRSASTLPTQTLLLCLELNVMGWGLALELPPRLLIVRRHEGAIGYGHAA